MSEEQLKAFLAKVKADTSLQEKLKAATTPEAGLEIAKAAGFSRRRYSINAICNGVRRRAGRCSWRAKHESSK